MNKKLFCMILVSLSISLPSNKSLAVTISYRSKVFAENGHHYEIIYRPNGINWIEAKSEAENRGGYLATVTSEPENVFITDIIKAHNDLLLPIPGRTSIFGPWIGGFQPENSSEPDGNWQWITGETFDYTNWAPGEPNDDTGEQYLHYVNKPGDNKLYQWNDATNGLDNVPTSTIRGLPIYIVEYEEVPEPLTVLGTLLATSFGIIMKKRR